MVAKKHPKRKPVKQDFTLEQAFARGRKITPKGYTYDSIFFETTRTKTEIVRRGVGIYKQRGMKDLQLYLDDKSVRTRRAKTADNYMTMVPTPPYPPALPPVRDTSYPIVIPKKLTPYNDVVKRLLLEKDRCIVLWAAEGASENALEARAMAKELGVKLPVRKKRKAKV